MFLAWNSVLRQTENPKSKSASVLKSRARGSKAADKALPRYLEIARQLTAAIADGRFPVGAQLPTELEICEELGISRFTAREAVRVLVNRGLVVRRQRVGTTVVATPDENHYTLALSSLRDLLQYAQHTALPLNKFARVKLHGRRARELGVTSGEDWICASGVRTDTERSLPLCVTRVYVNPVLPGIEAKLRKKHAAVYALIEKEYGIRIERVEQELQGVACSKEDAGVLGVPPNHPALRIIRRYYDDSGRLLEVADNIHPSDRFIYRMQLVR